MNRLKKIVLSAVAIVALSSSANGAPLLDFISDYYDGTIQEMSSLSLTACADRACTTSYAEHMLKIPLQGKSIGNTICKPTSGWKIERVRIEDQYSRWNPAHRNLSEQQIKAMKKREDNGPEAFNVGANCNRTPIFQGFTDAKYQYSVLELNFFSPLEAVMVGADYLDNTVQAKFQALDKYGSNITASFTDNDDALSFTIAYDMSTGGGGQNGFMLRQQFLNDGSNFIGQAPLIQNITLALYQSGEKREAIFKATNKTIDKQVLIDVINEMKIFQKPKAIERFVNIASGNDAEFEDILYKKLQNSNLN